MQDLEEKQFNLFLELIINGRPSLDFETKLGLSRRQVESYKTYYSINDVQDAKNLLNGVNADERQRKAEVKKLQFAKERELAEVREKTSLIEPRISSARVPNTKPHTDVVRDWNKQIEDEKKVDNLPEIDEDQFKNDANKGWRFLNNKYGYQRKVMLALLEKLKINVDVMPR